MLWIVWITAVQGPFHAQNGGRRDVHNRVEDTQTGCEWLGTKSVVPKVIHIDPLIYSQNL